MRDGVSSCHGPGVGCEELHLPITAAGGLGGRGGGGGGGLLLRNVLNSKAKSFLLVDLNAFYYLTRDFREVDVCVFERKTQFEINVVQLLS